VLKMHGASLEQSGNYLFGIQASSIDLNASIQLHGVGLLK
jgi:hypothetical protein